MILEGLLCMSHLQNVLTLNLEKINQLFLLYFLFLSETLPLGQ